MKLKIYTLALTLLFSTALMAKAKLTTKDFTYTKDGQSYKGFVAMPEKHAKKIPGVILVHEWWGHNEHIREQAQRVAELGYVAFAIDMFGDGKTADHPDKAMEYVKSVTEKEGQAQKNFAAAYEELKKMPEVDADKIAAMGYCFGGATVLNAARGGLPLKGVISIHGAVTTEIPAQKETLKSKILVIHGKDDAMVTPAHIEALKAEMKAAEANFKLVEIEGAKHAFTNPKADEFAAKFKIPVGYSEKADKFAFEKVKDFLKELF